MVSNDLASSKDLAIEINQRISRNISYLMSKNAVSQSYLSKIVQKKFRVHLPQGTISKICNGNSPSAITISNLKLICDALDINIAKVINDNLYSEEVKSKDISVHESLSGFISEENEYQYRGLLGEYYFYCFEDINSVDDKMLTGKVGFSLVADDKNSICSVIMDFPVSKLNGIKNFKRFKGVLCIDKKSTCSAMLTCEDSGEIRTIVFKNVILMLQKILCRVAWYITTDFDGNIIVRRILISRTRLSENLQNQVAAQLLLNDSNIRITKESLLNLLDNKEIPDEIYKAIISMGQEEVVFTFREALVKAVVSTENYNEITVINKLRKSSLSSKYNVVSKAVNDMAYKTINKPDIE